MDADVAVTEPRFEPIAHPRDRAISVHRRSSAAKISCLRRWLRVCGASHEFGDTSGFTGSLYWSSSAIQSGSATRSIPPNARPGHVRWATLGQCRTPGQSRTQAAFLAGYQLTGRISRSQRTSDGNFQTSHHEDSAFTEKDVRISTRPT